MLCSHTSFYSPLFWCFLGHLFVFMRMHEIIFCGFFGVFFFFLAIITMRKQLQYSSL